MKYKDVKYIVIGLVAVLVIVAGIFLYKSVVPNINAALEITDVLKPFLGAENQYMHLEMDASVGTQQLQMDANLYVVEEEETEFLVIEQENAMFYIAEDILFLENGKAFLIAEEENETNTSQSTNSTNFADILPLISTAYDEFEIIRTEKEAYIQYQITVTGEQVQKLLDATMMTQADMVTGIETIELSLVTKDGELEEISISGVANTNSNSVDLSVTVTEFEVLAKGEYEIPKVIKDSLQTVNKSELFCLTKDLYRLVKAVEPLSNMDDLHGSMTWKLSCGLLEIDTSIDLEKLRGLKNEENGKGEASTESGEIESIDDNKTAAQLIEVVGTLIMEGELSCTERNDAYVYQFVLAEDVMNQLAETIAPEIVSYAVEFQEGSMEVMIYEENISTISIEIDGRLNALITKIPASIGIEFNFQ